MDTNSLFSAIYQWSVADAIRQSATAFPWIETVHVLCISIVVGMIAVVDLRLLGIPAHKKPVSALLRETLPFVWGAFTLALISGGLLFASNATGYAKNADFQLKMVLIFLAFLNMLFFHLVSQRNLPLWDAKLQTPMLARLSGALSLLLWIGIVYFGRQIGFTLTPF